MLAGDNATAWPVEERSNAADRISSKVVDDRIHSFTTGDESASPRSWPACPRVSPAMSPMAASFSGHLAGVQAARSGCWYCCYSQSLTLAWHFYEATTVAFVILVLVLRLVPLWLPWSACAYAAPDNRARSRARARWPRGRAAKLFAGAPLAAMSSQRQASRAAPPLGPAALLGPSLPWAEPSCFGQAAAERAAGLLREIYQTTQRLKQPPQADTAGCAPGARGGLRRGVLRHRLDRCRGQGWAEHGVPGGGCGVLG